MVITLLAALLVAEMSILIGAVKNAVGHSSDVVLGVFIGAFLLATSHVLFCQIFPHVCAVMPAVTTVAPAVTG